MWNLFSREIGQFDISLMVSFILVTHFALRTKKDDTLSKNIYIMGIRGLCIAGGRVTKYCNFKRYFLPLSKYLIIVVYEIQYLKT
jgi:FtsH-binding integral membrane protein